MFNVLGVDFKHAGPCTAHTTHPEIMKGPTAPYLLSVNQCSIINKVFQLSIRDHFSLRRILEQVDMAVVYTAQFHRLLSVTHVSSSLCVPVQECKLILNVRTNVHCLLLSDEPWLGM